MCRPAMVTLPPSSNQITARLPAGLMPACSALGIGYRFPHVVTIVKGSNGRVRRKSRTSRIILNLYYRMSAPMPSAARAPRSPTSRSLNQQGFYDFAGDVGEAVVAAAVVVGEAFVVDAE